ncbi:glycosyltransferase family 4 protein [Vibrio anguillarum]|uniref:glycosyltransferase family 4 protein n=1 Tax=Vibrio anguillarum TaxID=55601 RepID=UPI00097E29AF|nr:glycosyltransferase family 4 protein [Vibrio anguillarum]MBT2948511.1 glycosyltransferase family 4 protein [Vibrio anguillarum]
MKNVLYVCSTLEQTGPSSQLFNIIKNLDLESYQARIITLSPEKEKSLYARFIKQGIEVYCLDPTGRESISGLKELLLGYLNSNKVDVIHTQGIRADIILSKIIDIISSKWVSTLRNIPYLDYPPQYGWFKGLAMAFMHILALRKCCNLVVVSYSVRDALNKFFNNGISVIPNGIDTEYYSSLNVSPETERSIRKKLNLDINKKLIVYTGVLEERKNIKMMLDVFEKLNGFQLLIIGDGSLTPMVQSHNATTTKKVIPVGSVSDVRPYLALANAFILISKAEGLPNSVLEALAMDVPSILSNIGPHREIQHSASSLVRLVEIDNSLELLNFLLNDYNSWRENVALGQCRNLSEQSFSASYNSSCYQALYK